MKRSVAPHRGCRSCSATSICVGGYTVNAGGQLKALPPSLPHHTPTTTVVSISRPKTWSRRRHSTRSLGPASPRSRCHHSLPLHHLWPAPATRDQRRWAATVWYAAGTEREREGGSARGRSTRCAARKPRASSPVLGAALCVRSRAAQALTRRPRLTHRPVCRGVWRGSRLPSARRRAAAADP